LKAFERLPRLFDQDGIEPISSTNEQCFDTLPGKRGTLLQRRAKRLEHDVGVEFGFGRENSGRACHISVH
jgi:hypothetical protein